jgi:hypothetical protein
MWLTNADAHPVVLHAMENVKAAGPCLKYLYHVQECNKYCMIYPLYLRICMEQYSVKTLHKLMFLRIRKEGCFDSFMMIYVIRVEANS